MALNSDERLTRGPAAAAGARALAAGGGVVPGPAVADVCGSAPRLADALAAPAAGLDGLLEGPAEG
jgi:hypothetical protein